MSRREKFLSFSVYSQVIVGKDLSIEREITPQLHTSAFGTVCIVAPSCYRTDWSDFWAPLKLWWVTFQTRTLPFTLHNKHTNFCYFIAGKLHIFSPYWMQERRLLIFSRAYCNGKPSHEWWGMCSHIVTLQFILATWKATNSRQPLAPVIPDVGEFRRMHFSDCRATYLSCQPSMAQDWIPCCRCCG